MRHVGLVFWQAINAEGIGSVSMLKSMSARPIAGVFALALMGGALTGCAGGPGGGINSGSELSAVPGDPCGQQRYEFGRSQTYFSDKIATGAITGGAIGAGTGALIGGLAGGWRGAGIGALAGLATGAVASGVNSYYSTMANGIRIRPPWPRRSIPT